MLVTLTDTQIRRLVAFAPRTFPWCRLHVLILTILDTGIRRDEALTLRWTDVDLDNLLLTVIGKGNKQRKVPISFELRKHLFRWNRVVHTRVPGCRATVTSQRRWPTHRSECRPYIRDAVAGPSLPQT